MNKLVVLGSVNADHVLAVPFFPRPGETLKGLNYTVIAGGKGANQAVAAARLGADTFFIACVGDDSFGLAIRKGFARAGINIDAVMVVENTPTGVAMIQVVPDGENSICISAEANDCLTADRLQPHHSIIREADMLLMQLESPLSTIKVAAEVAVHAGTKVVLNPAPAQILDDDLLSLIDIITPNETEAQLLTGITIKDNISAQKAADILHAKGVEIVLITLGSQGVWLSGAGYSEQIHGFTVKAIDSTAAGDTFNGALLTRLLEGAPMVQAIRFAHAAAAITVTAHGAQTSIPYRSDVNDFLDTV